MKPTRNTKFKQMPELGDFTNKDKYFCSAVVFSPETENDHFTGCPPYITINSVDAHETEPMFFEVPEIIAYYAKTHPCYTMKGKENDRKTGERDLVNKIKALLEIK